MPAFLEALSGKLAEKWLSLLVLPGLLLTGTAAVASVLGQRGWADYRFLVDTGDRLAGDLADRSDIATGLVVAAVLLTAAAAGFAAQTLGRVIERIWTGPWHRWVAPVGDRLTARRRRRWHALHDPYEQAVLRLHRGGAADETALRDLARDRNRIALAEPRRPTWMGDRLGAAEARVSAEYGLDLASAWPRLWLVLPEDGRAPVRQAVTALSTAAVLAGWGVLYLDDLFQGIDGRRARVAET